MEKEIPKICRECSLGELLSFEAVTEGVLSENYVIVTSAGKFFLKFCKNKSTEQIKYISNVERFMSELSIPAIKAIRVNEDQGWMLYPFVESDRTHSYDLQDYFIMGQSLGNVHDVSYNKRIPELFGEVSYNDSIDRYAAVERMQNYLKMIKQRELVNETDLIFISYIKNKLLYSEKINMIEPLTNDTIIHGDFHPGNLLISKKNRNIIGICDWEKAQYAPRSYDLARSYLYIGFGTDTDDISECLEISENFLRGYRSVIQISDAEFKKGLCARLSYLVFTTWIEDKYYKDKDVRANKFIRNSMRTLDYFLGRNH